MSLSVLSCALMLYIEDNVGFRFGGVIYVFESIFCFCFESVVPASFETRHFSVCLRDDVH